MNISSPLFLLFFVLSTAGAYAQSTEAAPSNSSRLRISAIAYTMGQGTELYKSFSVDTWNAWLQDGPVQPLETTMELAPSFIAHWNTSPPGLGGEISMQHHSRSHQGLHPGRELVVGLVIRPQQAITGQLSGSTDVQGITTLEKLQYSIGFNEYRLRLGYLTQTSDERNLRMSTGVFIEPSLLQGRHAVMHRTVAQWTMNAERFQGARLIEEEQIELKAAGGWGMHAWLPVRLTYRVLPYVELLLEGTVGWAALGTENASPVTTARTFGYAGGFRFLPGQH